MAHKKHKEGERFSIKKISMKRLSIINDDLGEIRRQFTEYTKDSLKISERVSDLLNERFALLECKIEESLWDEADRVTADMKHILSHVRFLSERIEADITELKNLIHKGAAK